MTVGSDVLAGPGGPVGVGAGWGSTIAWLVAAAVMLGLLVLVWWIAKRGRRSGRGAELALRRYDLRRPPRRQSAGGGRWRRPGGGADR